MAAGSEDVSVVVGKFRHRLGGSEEQGSGGRGSDGFRVRLVFGRRGVKWREQVEWGGV